MIDLAVQPHSNPSLRHYTSTWLFSPISEPIVWDHTAPDCATPHPFPRAAVCLLLQQR
eukprot:CAMPEP_0181249396 /NCGR_PEP_ID=MMETSP1096-20121128/45735_1 /TAXON_ID=156174 ORGANISM="Chrysochromulina ericina, Strain CCMP281" /NCGR_SAMPLE_ID=MMETSP1096 /ASSEMBLY_ACC=CAM_ASM_000453 /LENGTH=57 /DNA_ID=CAMNT_0023346737 /DNA_START=54 /DNA_END=224 /DNA_ORIENTATION=-